MLKVIMFLSGTALILAALFYVTKKIIMMWTGCGEEEASAMIWGFVTQSEQYHIAGDFQLNQRLWNVVHTIIGDQRYCDLERIAETVRVYGTGQVGGLCYIAITVICEESEKSRIERSLKAILIQYLKVHGFPVGVLTEWSINYPVQLPMLILQYAETSSQNKVLMAWQEQNKDKILQRHKPLEDDEEELS